MPNDKLEKLNKIMELMRNDTITPAELEKFLVMVLDVMKRAQADFNAVSSTQLDAIAKALEYIKSECEKAKADVQLFATDQKKSISEEVAIKIEETLAKANSLISDLQKIKFKQPLDGVTPIKGVDYFDGEQGTPGENGSPDSGEQVVEKINTLPAKPEFQIDAAHIKNLPKLSGSSGSGLRNVIHDTTLTGTGTVSDPLKVVGGGGSGTVTSVASVDGSVTVTNPTTTADLAVVKAPKLTTARTIAGVSFDGTANIDISASGLSNGVTGSGAIVLATSPTLVTPVLGVASATTINKVALTAPATGSTLTIDDGFTLHATGNVTALSGSHTGTSSGTNTGDQNLFSNIPVSGQTTVTANSATTALTLVAGSNITITTDNTAKSITIASSGGATGATTALDNLASVAINTALLLGTSDGAALGSSSKQWSDLFLASGALIDFANGNSVITHSSGILTVSTGDLRVTTAGTNAASVVTVGGSQTLTNKTLTTAVLGSSTATTQSANDNSTKVATTAYVDNAVLGQNFKEACKVATTAALVGVYLNGSSGVGATFTYTATGTDVIDGVTLALGDRVLVKNQGASDLQNGIYTVTTAGALGIAGILTRATDANQSFEYKTGDSIFVTAGTTQTSTTWAYTGIDSPTMGTTSLTYVQVAGQGSFTGGNGITITGTSIAIDTTITADLTTAQTFTNKTLTSPKINENVALTTTATKLNYLTSATGTTGTASTNIVFSTSPVLTTPNIGVATATTVNKLTITTPASGSTLTIIDGKTLTINKTMSFTAADDTGVYTLPTGTKTLLATDGSAASLTNFPTLNQNTTGSAATLTTARLLAGNSFNGSADVPFANKFIVQGTTDTGLSAAQFLGALATGILKTTTTTGVLSVATEADIPKSFSRVFALMGT